MANEWELRQQIVADSWDLAEEENGEDAGGGAEGSEGHSAGVFVSVCSLEGCNLIRPPRPVCGIDRAMDVARSAGGGGVRGRWSRRYGGIGKDVQLSSRLKSPSSNIWLDLVLWSVRGDVGAVVWSGGPWGNARSCAVL